ncbi:hypothetical protein GGI20_001028 [Coemansia sp. BCRC 34301]|nr:hypothetical protein GGI20_001028 [Coemansia sp. BCRC 34301]
MNTLVYFVGAFFIARALYSFLFPTMSAATPLSLDQIQEITKAGGTFNNSKITLLDVRTSDELKGGRIPHAVNVPVGELEDALKLESAAFRKKYDFDLPAPDSPNDALLVYCKSGRRTVMAVEMLAKKGYKTNLYAYHGGWDEYSALVQNAQ